MILTDGRRGQKSPSDGHATWGHGRVRLFGTKAPHGETGRRGTWSLASALPIVLRHRSLGPGPSSLVVLGIVALTLRRYWQRAHI